MYSSLDEESIDILLLNSICSKWVVYMYVYCSWWDFELQRCCYYIMVAHIEPIMQTRYVTPGQPLHKCIVSLFTSVVGRTEYLARDIKPCKLLKNYQRGCTRTCKHIETTKTFSKQFKTKMSHLNYWGWATPW